MSALEIAAVVASFVGIWLTAARRMSCWPVSLVACALYFKLFLDVRLYADMALQAVFGLAILYGWVEWARGRGRAGEVIVRRISAKAAVVGLAAGTAGAATIGCIMNRYTDASLPWMDSSLSSFSLVAQYWTARRYRESWLMWIAADVVYVGMFVLKALLLTAGLYAAMVVLAVLGYRHWGRRPPAGPTPPATAAGRTMRR